jgi:hypothetical protein
LIAAAAFVVAAAIIVPTVASNAHGTEASSASPTSSPSGGNSEVTPGPEPSATAHGMPIQPTFSSTPAAPDPSGQDMPTGNVTADGVTWTPFLSQDFTTPAATGHVLSTYPQMSAYSGFTDTSNKGLYSPNKVLSVHNSELDFYLHSEKGQPLDSSVLPDGYTGYDHMRVSIRYRADSIPGYKFVMILWPLTGATVPEQWNRGEIDWPEGNLNGNIRPASAIPGTYDASNGTMSFLPTNPNYATGGQTAWHTATVDWTKNDVTFYLDGKVIDKAPPPAVPNTTMRITLQAETTIDNTPVPASASGHVDVAWVVGYHESGD